jgi:hypothetical protein
MDYTVLTMVPGWGAGLPKVGSSSLANHGGQLCCLLYCLPTSNLQAEG